MTVLSQNFLTRKVRNNKPRKVLQRNSLYPLKIFAGFAVKNQCPCVSTGIYSPLILNQHGNRVLQKFLHSL